MTDFFAQFDTASGANRGAKLHLKNDKGEFAMLGDVPVTLSLYGAESDFYAVAKDRMMREAANRERPESGFTAEQEAAMRTEFSAQVLADMTFDWTGFPGEDGKEMSFDRKRVFEIYKNYNLIRTQADKFVSDSANFTKG